jgi:hypothetical protein
LSMRSPGFRRVSVNLASVLSEPHLTAARRQHAIQGVTEQWKIWHTAETATATQVSALMTTGLVKAARCGTAAKANGGQLSADCQALKTAMKTWAEDRDTVHDAMLEDYLWWTLARGKADAADPKQVVLATPDTADSDEPLQCHMPDFRRPPEGAAL